MASYKRAHNPPGTRGKYIDIFQLFTPSLVTDWQQAIAETS